MKLNRNPKLILIPTVITICSLMLLQSCDLSDDGPPLGCDNVTKNYGLSADQKGIIPYKGYDTISLISNSGDTIHCISKGVQLFTTRDFEKHSNPACGPNGTEKLYEANMFQFVDSLKNTTIQLENYGFYPDPPYKTFEEVVVSFKDKKFFIRRVNISDSTSHTYIGDVVIRGKTYLDVNKAELQIPDSTCFLLLNKTNGIIKIQLSPNEIWELLNP